MVWSNKIRRRQSNASSRTRAGSPLGSGERHWGGIRLRCQLRHEQLDLSHVTLGCDEHSLRVATGLVRVWLSRESTSARDVLLSACVLWKSSGPIKWLAMSALVALSLTGFRAAQEAHQASYTRGCSVSVEFSSIARLRRLVVEQVNPQKFEQPGRWESRRAA